MRQLISKVRAFVRSYTEVKVQWSGSPGCTVGTYGGGGVLTKKKRLYVNNSGYWFFSDFKSGHEPAKVKSHWFPCESCNVCAVEQFSDSGLHCCNGEVCLEGNGYFRHKVAACSWHSLLSLGAGALWHYWVGDELSHWKQLHLKVLDFRWIRIHFRCTFPPLKQ